ncbi:hypothetical protein AHF37_10096 [Paragonimus kellicotti]|nr:hypothetical protein AHF37_10096 [Paragonimus kellicotti]
MDPIAKLIDEELKKESCNTREQDMATTSVDKPTKLICVSLREQLAIVSQPLSTPSLVRVTILGILVFTCQSMVYYGLLLYARAVRESVYLVSFLNATTTIPAIALSSVLYRVVRHRRAPLISVVCARTGCPGDRRCLHNRCTDEQRHCSYGDLERGTNLFHRDDVYGLHLHARTLSILNASSWFWSDGWPGTNG